MTPDVPTWAAALGAAFLTPGALYALGLFILHDHDRRRTR